MLYLDGWKKQNICLKWWFTIKTNARNRTCSTIICPLAGFLPEFCWKAYLTVLIPHGLDHDSDAGRLREFDHLFVILKKTEKETRGSATETSPIGAHHGEPEIEHSGNISILKMVTQLDYKRGLYLDDQPNKYVISTDVDSLLTRDLSTYTPQRGLPLTILCDHSIISDIVLTSFRTSFHSIIIPRKGCMYKYLALHICIHILLYSHILNIYHGEPQLEWKLQRYVCGLSA